MAFISTVVTMVFDDKDTTIAKTNLKNMFEKQGYILVSEIKDQRNKTIEYLFQGTVEMGDFSKANETEGVRFEFPK